MIKELSSVSYDLTGSNLIAQLKYHEDISSLKPIYNSRVRPLLDASDFSNPDMVLIDKGRNIEEKAIVLIENDNYVGYGYADLDYQIENREVLHNIISAPKFYDIQNKIIKKYLKNHKIEKFIRF